MKPACIIPARGGSKRIPRKNIRDFHGKPIIAYSIDLAKKSKLFIDIYVSTEDGEIASIANKYGAKVIPRPPQLAEIDCPDVGTPVVMQHALSMITVHHQLACCLYATCPLLTVKDLKAGYNQLKAHQWVPYAISMIDGPPRDAGQFYWGRVEKFLTLAPLVDKFTIMIPTPNVIDINTPMDWKNAEYLYAQEKAA